MGRLFSIIRQFKNLLLFVFLQIMCLVMLYNYNKTYHTIGSAMANQVSGAINNKFNGFNDYLYLKQTNEQLAKRLEQLSNNQPSVLDGPLSAVRTFADTSIVDTLGNKKITVRFRELLAKVTYNSLFADNKKNFIQIHRGTLDGIKKDMALVSETGAIAGRIVEVSNHYATAISLLNIDFKVSAKHGKSQVKGLIEWDGKSPDFVQLNNVPAGYQINRGDSIYTSSFSDIFPENRLIGTVDTAIKNKSSNFYTIKVRPSTNFYTFSYAYAIDNRDRDEQRKNLSDAQGLAKPPAKNK
jgi:rod shape-determining protein MreC